MKFTETKLTLPGGAPLCIITPQNKATDLLAANEQGDCYTIYGNSNIFAALRDSLAAACTLAPNEVLYR